MARSNNRGRCGSVYMAVLGACMVVTVIGLGSLLAVKSQRQAGQTINNSGDARRFALTALEMGVHWIDADPTWRTNRTVGTWATDVAVADGKFTLQVADPVDNLLSNSALDPVVLTGIGKKGTSVQKVSVQLNPQLQGIDALNYALCVTGNLKVNGGKSLTAQNAPASVNGSLDNGGTITGAIAAGSVAHIGVISGTLTNPGQPQTLPDTTAFDYYVARATTIAYTGDMQDFVLGPGVNPWGAANADGVYYINAGNNDFKIRNARIFGTLVIKLNVGKKVQIENAVFMQNYRSDYPTLLVNGALEINHTSGTVPVLSETDENTNFNPVGAAFNGATDADKLGEYPNEIRGLVHGFGTVKITKTSKVRGVILSTGDVTIDDTPTVIYDPVVKASQPKAYQKVGAMKVQADTWKQIVD